MARTIRVDALARVEGEGALTIRFAGKKPKHVELRIFEPPRFFEGFLRDRSVLEAPDITARICGICPVAYQMSACQAIENALQVATPEPIRVLRRLLYCGEWIESHVLHAFMLHAPDFTGYQDALEMAQDHPERVRAALRAKKAGNAIVRAVGGREIHPINVRVGGFHRAPMRQELAALVPELTWSLGAMEESLAWAKGFDFRDFERDYELVCLRPEQAEYPFCEGRIVSNRGIDIDVREYDEVFEERHVEHSTALHSVVKERGAYLCGPLARFNLCFDRLRPRAQEAARIAGLAPPCTNPFQSLLVRLIETVQALDEALEIIDAYVAPDPASQDVPLHAATGRGASEAPRGLLYHRYSTNEEGAVTDAKIVPPTSQNQPSIEEDLFQIAPRLAEMPHAEATWLAEQTVRNYDPCISCSTHFLKVRIEQEEAT